VEEETEMNDTDATEEQPVWMNDPIEFAPQYWEPCPDPEGGIQRVENPNSITIEKELLIRSDSMFNYYLSGAPDDDEGVPAAEVEEFNLDKRLAGIVASKMNDPIGHYAPKFNSPPVWSKIRDRSSFITGGIISNKGLFQRHLNEKLTNHVFISAQGWDPDDEAVNDFGHLMYMAHNSARIIENTLADDLSARQAIDFLKGTPTERVMYRHMEVVKWVKEAEILDVHLRQHQTYQCNFNTIVITDTAKVAAKHGINWNSLYRLIAMLGRNNTRLIILD
jgi:hypothetical protein